MDKSADPQVGIIDTITEHLVKTCLHGALLSSSRVICRAAAAGGRGRMSCSGGAVGAGVL